jgi:hypothetical protein
MFLHPYKIKQFSIFNAIFKVLTKNEKTRQSALAASANHHLSEL